MVYIKISDYIRYYEHLIDCRLDIFVEVCEID